MRTVLEILGLVTAVIALYFSYQSDRKSSIANQIAERALIASELGPFDPVLTMGAPLWKVENVRSDNQLMSSLALITTVTIANRGAQQGCIADLASLLQVPLTQDRKNLTAYNFVNSEKLLEVIRRGRPLNEAYEDLFSPMIILGKQQISKTVLFRIPQLDRRDLREGSYKVSLVGRECAAVNKWTNFGQTTYVIAKSEIDGLLRGQATEFQSEEHIEAVRSLK